MFSILIHAASSAECKDEVCAVKKIWNERRKIVKTSERNGLPWTQTGTKRYNFKAVISKWTLWFLIFYKLLNRCTLQVKRTGLFWTNKRPWERISVRFSMSPADPRMIARYVDGGWTCDDDLTFDAGGKQGGRRQEAGIHGGHGQASPADADGVTGGREVRLEAAPLMLTATPLML